MTCNTLERPTTTRKVARPARPISAATAWMIEVRDNRSRAAFSRLFDHFAPKLKSMAMRSGMSAATADEIVQEAMLTVWHKAVQFDPSRAPVSAWIYQIARNKQIDHIRKTNRPVPEDLTQDGIEDADASKIVAREQEMSRLRQALSRLKRDQREVIERAYLGEMTHQEINRLTGVPLGTIKSRVRLALQRLHYELADLRQ